MRHHEMSPHMSQNACHQKAYKQYMLDRVWRKGNPVALLVGMEIDTDTMEDSIDIPLKTRNKTTI